MRKAILLLAGAIALLLIACLVAPDEPGGTSQNALSCTTGERAFNGACRKECTSSTTCTNGTSCMSVGPNVALCLEYKHCAYLGNDTQCSSANGGYVAYSSYSPYTPYSGWDFGYGVSPYGYGYGYGGGAGGQGCVGNATWQTVSPSGNPQCGVQHTVTRCAPIGGTCAFVSGSTNDVADP